MTMGHSFESLKRRPMYPPPPPWYLSASVTPPHFFVLRYVPFRPFGVLFICILLLVIMMSWLRQWGCRKKSSGWWKDCASLPQVLSPPGLLAYINQPKELSSITEVLHVFVPRTAIKGSKLDGEVVNSICKTSFRRLSIPTSTLGQWYSTFFVRVPPDIISLQLFTPKVVGA
jgi:hypothetical protein